MMTHHSVMTSSLHIKYLNTDKFDDFSSNINYNSKTKTHMFRDAISFIITHRERRHPKGASGGQKVNQGCGRRWMKKYMNCLKSLTKHNRA